MPHPHSLANLKHGGTRSPGRPKGLVHFIRRQTKDGVELARYALTIFRDETAKQADRMAAATWLADRAFGKPVQALEHSGNLDGPPLLTGAMREALADSETRAALALIAHRLAARALPPATGIECGPDGGPWPGPAGGNGTGEA